MKLDRLENPFSEVDKLLIIVLVLIFTIIGMFAYIGHEAYRYKILSDKVSDYEYEDYLQCKEIEQLKTKGN